MTRRGSGLLLHLSSLPSRFGIGDMGTEALNFIDFLVDSGQSYWQILPLNPTDPAFDNSPYKSLSAFAFNPLLISPEKLADEGLLTLKDLEHVPFFPKQHVNFKKVISYKQNLFDRAYNSFASDQNRTEFETFCKNNAWWLNDYALYKSLRIHFKYKIWYNWPVEARDRNLSELQKIKIKLTNEIEKEKFLQFICKKQWSELHSACRKKDIGIIGDIPIYVAMESADVWTNPDLFKLDENKKPITVAGVPPDYFSKTGQLWGNPVYRWDELEKSNFSWWLKRIEHNLNLFDIVRIDHFRGLVAYWEVPYGENTAINGRWVNAPADSLLNTIQIQFDNIPIIAEDLGHITPDVKAIMEKYDLPGMRVLQFGFSDPIDSNEHFPNNLKENSFLFTGTHDNNTTIGWFNKDATENEKNNLKKYLDDCQINEKINWAMICSALKSVARKAIIPAQDALGLNHKHRMNTPSVSTGNWKWRVKPGALDSYVSQKLYNLVKESGRLPNKV